MEMPKAHLKAFKALTLTTVTERSAFQHSVIVTVLFRSRIYGGNKNPISITGGVMRLEMAERHNCTRIHLWNKEQIIYGQIKQRKIQ